MFKVQNIYGGYPAGAEWINNGGYVVAYCPNHPNAMKDGTILKHRIVMSAFLNRPLVKGEIVHHVNRVKTDNEVSNLKIVYSDLEHTREHHIKQTKEEKIRKQIEWQKKNPDKVKAAQKRNREKHREKRMEYNRKYRDANREKLRAYDRRKYAEEKMKKLQEKGLVNKEVAKLSPETEEKRRSLEEKYRDHYRRETE